MLSDCTGEAIVPGRYLNQLIDYPLLKLLKDFFQCVFPAESEYAGEAEFNILIHLTRLIFLHK